MLRFRNTIVILLLLASLPCGCSTAEREEWDRAWSKPWFGGSSGIGKPEPWTIECNAYEGPNRRAMADRMATLLKKVPELPTDDVWVEHTQKQSRVFCGVYPLRYVEAETDGKDRLRGDVIIRLNDRVKRDLAFVRQLALGEEHPFFSARPIRKPIPDVGPPEWNLRNAKGVYTLNVGITYPSPTLHNYKEAAVAWVRDLREHGHEAYYYHDPDKPRTSICIGTFGEDAFQRDSRGRKGYGSAVKALQSKDQFKYNLENGYKVYKVAMNRETSRKERIPNYSFLVKIPRDDERASH